MAYEIAIGLASATGTLVFGIIQYSRAQRWKRAEWLTHEMEKFFSDEAVIRALTMIDWEERTITFPAEDKSRAEKTLLLTDEIVAAALQSHRVRKGGHFSEDEARIRDTFDRFLNFFEWCSSWWSAGLVSTDDLKPYLGYWINKIRSAEEGGEAKRLIQLRAYIEEYGFTGVQRLFRAYKGDPLVSDGKRDWWQHEGSRPLGSHTRRRPPL